VLAGEGAEGEHICKSQSWRHLYLQSAQEILKFAEKYVVFLCKNKKSQATDFTEEFYFFSELGLGNILL
jgi:hypothetical protein